jgi:hypothetical protein
MRISIISGIILFWLLLPSHTFASTDLTDLFLPADPSDVVSAGLVLPGEWATSPDTSRPLSLLQFSPGISLQGAFSRPWRQTGGKTDHLELQTWKATVLLNDNDKFAPTALAVSSAATHTDLAENNGEWSRGDANIRNPRLAVAHRAGSWRAGLSTGSSQQSAAVSSTRLSGIETVPGTGLGRLAWRQQDDNLILEAVKHCGRMRVGGAYSRAQGDFLASTHVEHYNYFADAHTDLHRYAPYIAWDTAQVQHLLLATMTHADMAGPLAVGRLQAGRMHGNLENHAVAYVRRQVSAHRLQLVALEYSHTEAGFAGRAGGFIFPGIFNDVYAVEANLDLDKISARWGVQTTRGRTAIRYAALVGYGLVDGRLTALQKKWLRPPRLLANERLEDAGLWFCAPAVGAGYQGRGWRVDAGLVLCAAVLTKQVQHVGRPYKTEPLEPTSVTATAADSGKHVWPAMRFGMTLRQDF